MTSKVAKPKKAKSKRTGRIATAARRYNINVAGARLAVDCRPNWWCAAPLRPANNPDPGSGTLLRDIE